MNTPVTPNSLAAIKLNLPIQRGAYYGGTWHEPKNGRYAEQTNPGTGDSLGRAADSGAEDIDAAVRAAKAAFAEWRRVPPLERARMLKGIARVLRENAGELAMIDSADCGNPISEMIGDANVAAAQVEFFAGLVTEMKGHSIPQGPDRLNFSVREPLGVVGRIVPFNHPFMFIAGKAAAPLAAGNTIVMKPPEQAPLSSLRLAELIDGLLPPGVFNLVPGGKEAGAALASHPGVAKIALIGSVPTGKAVMRAAADTLKRVLLELGGKNALIAYPDADPDAVAGGVVGGMNFTWCGQSCGSTSRAFIHEKILDRVISYIASAKSEGARLITGGGPPSDPALAKGFYIEPTVFADVKPTMKIAREEIFGPVVGVFRWSDEASMLEQVNAVEYGLTASIWTNDLGTAHRAAGNVEAGYIWINDVSKHFLGTPFGGYKQSGIGREECLEELLSFTQEKNININLAASSTG